MIRSENTVKVQFQTSGRLAWLGVKEGDLVKKGQALASLDKQDLEKRFKKEMNDYLNERWDFEQTQDDYRATRENALVTDSIKRILEKAQFDLESSVLEAEIADLAIKFASIYAPVGGIVTQIEPAVAGLNVVYTTAFIEIMDPGKMGFEAIVDEIDIPKLKAGQKVVVSLDAFPDLEFEGEIKRISFKATQTTAGGTAFLVYVSLPESLIENLRSGFNGDFKAMIEKKEDVLVVPSESIFEEEGGIFVYKVKEDKVLKTKIETGLANEDLVEISSGLDEGDLIVTENPTLLKNGQEIKLK